MNNFTISQFAKCSGVTFRMWEQRHNALPRGRQSAAVPGTWSSFNSIPQSRLLLAPEFPDKNLLPE